MFGEKKAKQAPRFKKIYSDNSGANEIWIDTETGVNLLRKYPAVAHAMKVRYQRYNHLMEEIDKEEAAGDMLVIRPPQALNIGSVCHDPDELERVYQIGRQEGRRRLKEVQVFLEK